ncbi:3-oxoacid CoA-transferase [Microbacterium ulmi]|uniref:3-oxoacid CoA-transferase subunit A n=1 Tax=Microbacterium ulmi TaxID=179095 RepID=A0A7Y2PZD2_9MICO|nr:3-oxoacid CoA-transferase subunit A [Microbacterium ulmi]NII69860.1 3-oxoacid CoA-transferase [Microbacterium ulmi]NNH03173.1 3-oxoacid CoA-transferase subunit A [Microbacterium ulmi]
MDKVFESAAAAIADIPDGATIALTGFGLSKGIAASLIVAARDRGVRDLTIVCNSLGSSGQIRAQMLVENRQVKRLVCSFSSRPGIVSPSDEQVDAGLIEVELVPQGILVERLRAGAAGLGAIYSPVGIGTPLAAGKEKRVFDGREFVLEPAITVDYTFARAWRADRAGNVQFRGSNIHFNTSMAKAARVAIVEVDEIVEVGEIPSEAIDLPGVFVARVVPSTVKADSAKGTIRLRRAPDAARTYSGKSGWTRHEMARKAISLIPDDSYVNIGSGMPALIAQNVGSRRIVLHGENGILGYGEAVEGADADPDVFDAGGNDVTVRPGTSFFDSVTSFEIARGGRLDVVVLGAYQVDETGSFASYSLGDPVMGGIGGAMDLVAGGRELVVMMEHQSSKGTPKLVERCTLPLTGADCVTTVVTDIGVFRRREDGFHVQELADGFTFEDVQALTTLPLRRGAGE